VAVVATPTEKLAEIADVEVAAITLPAVVKPLAKPKPVRKAAPVKKDDLKLIKGIGPVNEGKLNKHGIKTFAQIAAWKKADIVEAEAYLEFDGRIAREDWVGQSRKLARETAKAAIAKGRK
jgi:branched-chain amino acid transport system ATP-binding protein